MISRPKKPQMWPLLIVAALVMATPAVAGRWITGGTLDVERGIGVSFLRFLSEPGEGQMTIRCDQLDGLWIDAGVAGNGELPDGVQQGDLIDATFTFVRGGEEDAVVAAGPVLVRGDGAVLIAISGENAFPLGPALLVPAERLDLTIAGRTLPIPFDGVSEDAIALSERCGAWPF